VSDSDHGSDVRSPRGDGNWKQRNKVFRSILCLRWQQKCEYSGIWGFGNDSVQHQ